MSRLKTISLLALVVALAPVSAFAYDMEFYTYGGFDAVVTAFNKLALMFGSSGYMGLFAITFVAGLFLGGCALYYRAAMGGKGSMAGWLIPIMLGMLFYTGLMVPKGTIYIHDQVLNKDQAIGGIPDAMVLIAGITNMAERTIVDLISDTGTPAAYDSQAGGIGFVGLLTLLKDSSIDKSLIEVSLSNYVKDCFIYDAPLVGFDPDILKKTSVDFRDVFELVGTNPAMFTVYYPSDNSAPQGMEMNCRDAWGFIKADLADPKTRFGGVIKSACGKIGMGGSAFETTRCETIITDTISAVGLFSKNPSEIAMQSWMTKVINDTFNEKTGGGTMGALNYSQSISNQGVLMSAAVWLPYTRAAILAIAIGLFPALALLVTTPLFGKVLKYLAGTFVWLAVWGITDAVVHGFIMDYAMKTMEGIRQFGGLGLESMFTLPDEITKTLNMFASMRLASLGIASTISTGLFGAVAFAGAAGEKAAQKFTADGSAASNIEARGARSQGVIQGMVKQSIANDYSVRERVDAGVLSDAGNIVTANTLKSAFGGIEGALDSRARMELGRTFNHRGAGDAAIDLGALGTERMIKAAQQKAMGGALETIAKTASLMDSSRTGMSQQDVLSHFAKVGADYGVGAMLGQQRAWEGAVANGYKGSLKEFSQLMSEVGTLGKFSDAKAITDLAKRHNTTEAVVMQANSDFQAGKHYGEVQTAVAAIGRNTDQNAVSAASRELSGVYQSRGVSKEGTASAQQALGTLAQNQGAGTAAGMVAAYRNLAAQKGKDFNMSFEQFAGMMNQAAGMQGNPAAMDELARRNGLSAADLGKAQGDIQTGRNQVEAQRRIDTAEAGRLIGQATGAKSGAEAAIANERLAEFMRAHSDRTMGDLANNEQFRNLASQATPDEMRKNPEFWQNGQLTQAGVHEFQKRVAGAGQPKYVNATGDGSESTMLRADGTVATNEGWRVTDDKASLMAIANQLDATGKKTPRGARFQEAAKYVRKLAEEGGALKYSFEKDGKGNIATFNVDKGGTVERLDLAKGRSGKDFEKIDRDMRIKEVGSRSWSGVVDVDQNTKVTLTESYSQVDKTLTDQKNIDNINKMLRASGSEIQVGYGDSIQMRVGPQVAANKTKDGLLRSHGDQGTVSTISSFSVRRGGTKEQVDLSTERIGKLTQTFDNRTERKMGVDVVGAGSAVIREVAGQKGAEVIIGTTNATTATMKNVGGLFPKLKKIGKGKGKGDKGKGVNSGGGGGAAGQ